MSVQCPNGYCQESAVRSRTLERHDRDPHSGDAFRSWGCDPWAPLASPRHIRLLKVHPAADYKAEVECSLIQISLDEGSKEGQATTGSYAALSYTWGLGPPSQSITVAGRRIAVRNSLHEALLHLRGQDHGLVLWVDTLCINQRNESEVVAQVSMMYEIYYKASKVIVSPGTHPRSPLTYFTGIGSPVEAGTPTQEKKDSVDTTYVARKDKSLEEQSNGGDVRGDAVPKETSLCLRQARPGQISGIESAAWFTRGWTLQELLDPRRHHLALLEALVGDMDGVPMSLPLVLKDFRAQQLQYCSPNRGFELSLRPQSTAAMYFAACRAVGPVADAGMCKASTSRLHAVGSGQKPIVGLLLQGNPEAMKALDSIRLTPLHLAVERGSSSVVDLLIGRHAGARRDLDRSKKMYHSAMTARDPATVNEAQLQSRLFRALLDPRLRRRPGVLAAKGLIDLCTPPLLIAIHRYASMHKLSIVRADANLLSVQADVPPGPGITSLETSWWLRRHPGNWPISSPTIDWIADPSPLAFLWCSIATALLLRLYAYLNRYDQYQGWFLVCGIATWLLISIAARQGPLASSLCIMPWTMSASLVVSDIAHMFLRSLRLPAVEKGQLMCGCEAGTEMKSCFRAEPKLPTEKEALDA